MCLKSFGALKEIDQNSLVPFWFSSLLLERETSRNCRILLNFLLEQTLSQFCSQLYTHRSSLMMHKFKCNTSPSCLNRWRLWREEEKLNNLLDFISWGTFGWEYSWERNSENWENSTKRHRSKERQKNPDETRKRLQWRKISFFLNISYSFSAIQWKNYSKLNHWF